MLKPSGYHIKIDEKGHYSVLDSDGDTAYDTMDEWVLADVICQILNQGWGPEWDKIQGMVNAEVKRRKGNSTRFVQ